jgi:Ca2+-binding RTX toxin-like protein
VLTYTDTNDVLPFIANALVVSLASSVYTIDDPAEAAIVLLPNALDAGCAAFDSNTVTCPASAIVQLNIATRNGDDHIVLTGAAHPAFLNGGRGNDTIGGGDAGDVFLWVPGDGNDTLDGGPGVDELAFNGANISEIFTITPTATGFTLSRNIALIQMVVDDTERLVVRSFGGSDEVFTSPLVATAQNLIDSGPIGDDGSADVLHVDAGGLCLVRENDAFEVAGRQLIHFVDFPQIFVDNLFCPADPCEVAVATEGCTVNHVRNQPCVGTPGDDVIVGTAAGDIVLGGGGRDRISGMDGDDLLCGEAGDDVMKGGTGDDTLIGGPDADRLKGDHGNDTLRGGEGGDILTGGAGNDDLDGGEGDDRVKGSGGLDRLQGGLGVDRIDGGGGDDQCIDTDEIGPFAHCEL